ASPPSYAAPDSCVRQMMRGEPMATTPLGPAPLAMAFATLICVCVASGRSGHAADLDASRAVAVAAASFGSDRSHASRPDLRSEDEVDLEWLLAQSAAPTTAEASGETVIVVFPSSAPASVEEDVAKAHKLEFVRRLEVGSSDGRVVLYRVADGRSAADVAEALKGDLRVGSAQPNVRYT